ncbi:hypothetical protein BDW42DRAFT_162669, partial [Aspergillus taichungensis]
MEKLEGITVSERYFRDLGPEEQQEPRNAFKSSYLEFQERGFHHLNANPSNLIWDKQKMKCYISDWEAWVRIAHPWNDAEYSKWSL